MSSEKILEKVTRLLLRLFQVVWWYLEAVYRTIIPPPMKSIDGETILVTGATGGIGKEICKCLVKSGSNLKIVLWDLNLSDLEKFAGELKTIRPLSGLKVFTFAVDISTRENIDSACHQVKEVVGPVTIIFNNAGIAPNGNFLQLKNEEIDKTININLMSQFWIIRQFLPHMAKSNHGRIVCTASFGALKPAPHAFTYFSSKFGVHGMMEALRLELQLLKYDGIHCTTIFPFFVKTPLIGTLGIDQANSSSLPGSCQKFLEPVEVAVEAVNGMRREYEYVYVPSILSLLVFREYFMPTKLRKSLVESYSHGFMYNDAEEQKRFKMLYEMPAENHDAKKDL